MENNASPTRPDTQWLKELKNLKTPTAGGEDSYAVVTRDQLEGMIENFSRGFSVDNYVDSIQRVVHDVAVKQVVAIKDVNNVVLGIPMEQGGSIVEKIAGVDSDGLREVNNNYLQIFDESIKSLYDMPPTGEGFFGTMAFIVGLSLRSAVKDQDHISNRIKRVTEILKSRYKVTLKLKLHNDSFSATLTELISVNQAVLYATIDNSLEASTHFHGAFVQATKDLGFGAPANVTKMLKRK